MESRLVGLWIHELHDFGALRLICLILFQIDQGGLPLQRVWRIRC